MELIRFAKMHGSGNDFMVIDACTRPLSIPFERISQWANRRSGIGFDQLLVLHPPNQPTADFRMQVFNADGTEAEQCGNGARCIPKFTLNRRLSPKQELMLETLGGPVRLCCHEDLSLNTARVEVELCQPILTPSRIPFIADGSDEPKIPATVEIDGGMVVEVTPLSMGNPHAVVFVPDVEQADVSGIGSLLQQHDCFPQSANVEFLEVVNASRIRLRIYERGVGETMACGTGASAAVVAGVLHGRVDDTVDVQMRGGSVTVSWRGKGSTVKMTGIATLVYEGSIVV